MAKWTIGSGIDTYIADLNKLLVDEDTIIRETIYKGAKLVIDRVVSEINNIPARNYDKESDLVDGITNRQKQGLLDSIGIADIRKDGGFVNMKVGVDGYNSQVTEKFPRGQPNALIVRSLEAGTSFRYRNPFMTRATNASRAPAESAMKNELDAQIKKRIH